ncbi:hypothetical protein AB4212_02025 [Streptomyces sp. 2MCAF27]
MGLRPAAQRVPHIGNRLLLRAAITALDYGHPDYTMRLPSPGADWRSHVAQGGQACIVLGLDPFPPGMGRDATAAYLSRVVARGQAYMGASGVRDR